MNKALSISRAKSRVFLPLVFLAAFAVILGLLAVLAFALRLRGAPPLAAGVAPDFTLVTFDGQSYRLADLKGKAVVVNFWASWCIPCRDEAPALEKAWQRYRERGLVVVGVDYVDTEPEAAKFIADFRQSYPDGPDVGTRISQEYHISGVPETYFVGRDGRLLQGIDSNGHPNGNWIGPLAEDALNSRIELMLAQ